MAKTDLTLEKLKSFLEYDPATGEFIWVGRAGYKTKIGSVAGHIGARGYCHIGLCGTLHYAHRLAWFYVHGFYPLFDIDHIDGNKSNNRLANLRDVPHQVNQQNKRVAHVNSKSSFLGVTKAPFNKWMARIRVEGKSKYLGHFTTEELAHEAYLDAKRRLHEGCTI